MRLTFIRKDYPLVFPFQLSYGTYYHRTGFLVMVSEDEFSGYGELSLVPYYGKKERDIIRDLEDSGRFLAGIQKDWSPEEVYRELSKGVNPDPVVRSAIDGALLDLYGRKTGRPVWSLVGSRREVKVFSSLTLTGEDWQQKLTYGWPVLKLKMGFDGDMDLLEDVRRHYSGPLRVDANGGWDMKGLEKRMYRLAELGVSLVEQPLPPGKDDLLKERGYPVPLAADESAQTPDDLDRLSGYYEVINIKLQKSGGITPTLQMIDRARKLGLKLMIGCMTESSVGIGAAAHLASFFDYLDLDGEYLIRNRIGRKRFVERGKINLSDQPGLGMDFDVYG